ncbi:ABC transporter substrate-binding protein [Piscinibacter gummiphilus]|uniref:ABC transporter substrate-binding protein n=1 Tax=Piscinibacter gummiphilus TaxID=946333 RepID=A0ABZ0CZ49_9BURK|nr:ABC transporter substrate-binding protein [Piscinibacter gummiphilus]WOB10239.1 ABC transporter substrate-binding protein [Piscinibacter gummiphilus]
MHTGLKTRTRSRSGTWIASVALMAGATLASAQETITIGQVAPLSGVLASTGHQMVLGGKVYFDAVNEAGGVHGAKIRTLVLDDGYKVDETLRLTKELVAKPEVLALFGFAGTANIGKLLEDKVLADAGIALVAPYTGGELLRKPFNPWIFHVRAGYADETEHMIKQLNTQGLTRVAVLYQNDAFGTAGLAGVESALQRRGRKLVASAGYERNTTDVDAAVKVIRAASPQAVIMVAVNKPAAAFAKQYRAAGGGGQLFNISVVDPAELVKLGGLENVRGLGISQVVPYPYRQTMPVVREFHEAMKKYAPKDEVNYTNFEEYLGAKVLVEALRRAGPKPTRAKVMNALESINNHNLGGVRISYGPKERVGSRFVEVTVIGSQGKLLK